MEAEFQRIGGRTRGVEGDAMIRTLLFPFLEIALKFRVLIEQDEDGAFVAQVPSLPGCISQGTTREDALRNVKEAIAGYLESLNAHDEPIPPPIGEEVVDVAV